MSKLKGLVAKGQGLLKSKLASNSIWGVAASVIQSVLLSLFFVIMARKYSTNSFAHFLIANTLYQLLVAFSNLGLGQWFTREIVNTEVSKLEVVSKFLKMQLFSGLFFYIVSIVFAFVLYKDIEIRNLILILGINIVFDNVIYGIKNLNIAEFKQSKSLVVLSVDSILKFSIALLLYVYPFSIFTLSVFLIIARFVTLNFFIAFGSSNLFNLRGLLKYKLSLTELKNILAKNWSFVIIGSVSVVYWRCSNIIVSKLLSLKDVTHFEVSFRMFSLAQILPVVISISLFPSLVKWMKEGNLDRFKAHYNQIFNYYFIYGVFVFTFFYAFSDSLVPWAFGSEYVDTPIFTKQMFLTILVYPTAIMQASVLVALNLEKVDMWLNVTSLSLHLGCSLCILRFVPSLTVINLSIFGSFAVFHICQDYVLIKKKICSIHHVLKFYITSIILVIGFILLHDKIPGIKTFACFWIVVIVLAVTKVENKILYKLNMSK